MPVILVVVRQVRNMVKCSSAWASGSFKSELFRVKTQAHRLVGVRPSWTQVGHHFNSSIHKLAEKDTRATGGSQQVICGDECVK